MSEAIEGTAQEVEMSKLREQVAERIERELHQPIAERLLPAVPPAPVLAVTPQVKPAELVARLDAIKETAEKAMTEDVDYGVIPGTGGKPTLLKPGAEKLGVLFQLDIQLVNEKTWGPGDHLTVVSHATVFHAPTGARLGYGEGVCSTREKKYAVRKQERTCPHCRAAAVIKGKAEFGGGWLCWKKRGGCGAKFPDGDPAIEGQEVGDIENPDLPDLWNTTVKMAEKRARVDAVLAVTGASAIFTQDAEDMAPGHPIPDEPRRTAHETPQQRNDPTPEQLKELRRRVTSHRLLKSDQGRATLTAMLEKVGAKHVDLNGTWTTSLSRRQVSGLLDQFSEPLPDPSAQDVPSDIPWSPGFSDELPVEAPAGE